MTLDCAAGYRHCTFICLAVSYCWLSARTVVCLSICLSLCLSGHYLTGVLAVEWQRGTYLHRRPSGRAMHHRCHFSLMHLCHCSLAVCFEGLSVSSPVSLSVLLSVCLRTCMPVQLAVCLSVCLPACLCVWVCGYLPACLSTCAPVCLYRCLSVCLSAYLSHCLSACLPPYVSASVLICLSVGLGHGLGAAKCRHRVACGAPRAPVPATEGPHRHTAGTIAH